MTQLWVGLRSLPHNDCLQAPQPVAPCDPPPFLKQYITFALTPTLVMVPGGSRDVHTFGQLSVPHAIAATACAPPAFSTWVTPAFFAQYSTSGVTLPSRRGGVAITIVRHPAMPAGTASMRVEDGSTALPPGTYSPTASAHPDLREILYYPDRGGGRWGGGYG